MLLLYAATVPDAPPAPLLENYTLDPVDPVMRTDMEAGAPRSRITTRARNDRANLKWRFSESEMANFRNWWRDVALSGASWVTLPLSLGEGGEQNVECRFTAHWKATLLPSLIWEVSASVEVR